MSTGVKWRLRGELAACVRCMAYRRQCSRLILRWIRILHSGRSIVGPRNMACPMPESTVDFVLLSTYTTSGFRNSCHVLFLSSLSPPLVMWPVAGCFFGDIGQCWCYIWVRILPWHVLCWFLETRLESTRFCWRQSADFFVREQTKRNHAVQRSQIHSGKPSPDGGRLHQIDEIQGLLRSCWSNSGFLGIWVRVRQAGTDADGFDRRNDWPDLCRFGRIAGHSRSIDGIQRERKGGEAVWCSSQSTRA